MHAGVVLDAWCCMMLAWLWWCWLMLYMGMLLDAACMGMVLDAACMGTLVLDDACILHRGGAGCYLQGFGCKLLYMVMLAWPQSIQIPPLFCCETPKYFQKSTLLKPSSSLKPEQPVNYHANGYSFLGHVLAGRWPHKAREPSWSWIAYPLGMDTSRQHPIQF